MRFKGASLLRAVLLLLTIPLLCGWSTSGSTTTKSRTQYFLDRDGGNDGWTGTSRGDPWATIAQLEAATTAPNDEVYFQRGDTWNDANVFTIQQSGAAGNPITFTAYGTGAAPIISANGFRTFCIEGVAKDYITIRGLHLTGWINSGIYLEDSSYWNIEGNVIAVGGNGPAVPDHNIWVSSSAAAALRPGIVIDGNTIGTNQTGEDGAIGSAAVLVSAVDGAVISNNSINTTYVVGIWLTLNAGSADNTDVVIENNDMYGNYGNIITDNSDGTIIRYNTIRDGKGAGIGVTNDSDNVEIYYNLIYDLDTAATWNGFDITDDSDSGVVYNNTVYEVFRHSLMLDDGAGAVPNNWIIKNNIFDASANIASANGDPQPRGLAIGIRNTPITLTSDYNILVDGTPVGDVASHGIDAGTLYTFLGWQGLGYGTHSDDSDPLFTNAGAEIFTLQSGSPAENTGDATLGLTRDILGNPIVGIPDMGAYERQ